MRLTEAQAMARLKQIVKLGSAKNLAASLGISQQYLSDVLAGRRNLDGVMARLGFRRVKLFEWDKGD